MNLRYVEHECGGGLIVEEIVDLRYVEGEARGDCGFKVGMVMVGWRWKW